MEQTQTGREVERRFADSSVDNAPQPPTTNETRMTHAAHSKRPAIGSVILAFTCLYISWGTTYYAIRVGVETLPPALFAGTRLGLAGLVLLTFLAARGQRLWLPRRELVSAAVVGVCMFVVGNGLITLAEKSETSIAAAVLVATTPIWFALLETLWPWGERLTIRGWLGLGLGLAGVLVLLLPKMRESNHFFVDAGPLLILGSAISWAIGSCVLRHTKRHTTSHLLTAAYQMVIGGGSLTLVGLLAGETGELSAASFTAPAIGSFFYLLVVGSLVGYVAYNWLLGHVSGALVGTYAYVNPVVAILVGWQLGKEELSPWIVGGMAIILAGVALVRIGGVRAAPKTPRVERNGERDTINLRTERAACGLVRDV
jgi:drug/metabolite transporter (DMT)-like permease